MVIDAIINERLYQNEIVGLSPKYSINTTAFNLLDIKQVALLVRFNALRLFHVGHVCKIGEVSFQLIGTNGFHVRDKE